MQTKFSLTPVRCLNSRLAALQKCLRLRCFDTVFQRPYRYFSIALKVFFSLSDRYKLFTSYGLKFVKMLKIYQSSLFNDTFRK